MPNPTLDLHTLEDTIRTCPPETIPALAHTVLRECTPQYHGYLLLSPALPVELLPAVLKSLASCKDPWILYRTRWHAQIPAETVGKFRGVATCQLLIHLHRAVLLKLTPPSCLPDLTTQQKQMLRIMLRPTDRHVRQVEELQHLQRTVSLLQQPPDTHQTQPDIHTNAYAVRSSASGPHGHLTIDQFRLRCDPDSLRLELKPSRIGYRPMLITFSLPDAYHVHAQLTAVLHQQSPETFLLPASPLTSS